MLNYGIFVPHPPAILPGVADAEIKNYEATIRALLSIALELKKNPPQTLVVLSPHADAEINRFLIRVPKAAGFTADLSELRTRLEPKTYQRDRILTAQLIESLNSAGLNTGLLEEAQLDAATAIPLHFLTSALPEFELVNIATSLAGIPEHCKLGEVIAELAEKSSKSIALIASGELSHKLTKTSPLGFAPAAEAWEENLLQAVANQSYAEVFHADPFELDAISESGVRPLAALLAAFEKSSHLTRILAHEAPGGIGLATIILTKRA
ncbi:MAG: AmmeMemoRadiSam system protein B [Candidatus Peribacteraceae bacterium]|nr:AmmeMemoRadiSam system protein B [Candidatus Peribacteraceae bacterium]